MQYYKVSVDVILSVRKTPKPTGKAIEFHNKQELGFKTCNHPCIGSEKCYVMGMCIGYMY